MLEIVWYGTGVGLAGLMAYMWVKGQVEAREAALKQTRREAEMLPDHFPKSEVTSDG